MAPFDPFTFHLLLANYAALVVLLPIVLVRRRRALLDGIPQVDRVGLVAMAVVALLVRVTMNFGFQHENGHAWQLLDLAIDPSSNLHAYGSGYVALFSPLFAVFPPMSEVLIGGVLVLGALTVLPAGLLVTRLFGPRTGVVSALALAFLNSHALHSASESRFVVVLAFLLLALWLAVETARTGRWDVAFVCALAAAPAAQMRIELVFTPLVVLAFAFLLRGSRPLIRRPAGWILVASLAALLAGHVRWLWQVHSALPSSSVRERLGWGTGFVEALWNGNILLDGTLLPRLTLVLAILSVIVAFRSRPREVLLLGGTAAGFVVLYAQTSHQYVELERFVIPAQTFIACLAGPGALALARMAERRSGIRGVTPALAAALVLVGPEPFPQNSLTHREYSALWDLYADVPQGCRVVTLGPSPDDRVLPPFSVHELLYRTGGRELELIGEDTNRRVAEALASQESCVLYLRTSACFAREVEESAACDEPDVAPPEVQPRCARFEDAFVLEPVGTQELPPRELGPSRFHYPAEPFEIGFFRVTSRR